MKIGDRVKVIIQDRKRYAVGCAEKLDGARGVIEEIKENSTNSISGRGPAHLVRFDQPIKSWWSGGLPVAAFWFDPSELF